MPSLRWGTGLSKFQTYITAPNYWAGQNRLGTLMIDPMQKLMSNENQGNYREEKKPEDTESIIDSEENFGNNMTKNTNTWTQNFNYNSLNETIRNRQY